jgi:hypothetical protein
VPIRVALVVIAAGRVTVVMTGFLEDQVREIVVVTVTLAVIVNVEARLRVCGFRPVPVWSGRPVLVRSERRVRMVHHAATVEVDVIGRLQARIQHGQGRRQGEHRLDRDQSSAFQRRPV